jgi:hypothetical protein
MHALNIIAQSGSLPMVKAPLATEGRDATLAGNLLAATVIAQAMTEGNVWKRYARTVVYDLTTDGRVAFIKAVKASIKDIKASNAKIGASLDKAGNANPSKDEVSRAAKLVNSATTQVHCLTAIANAFNVGGTVEDLLQYCVQTRGMVGAGFDDVGFALLTEYARTFSESKAGRKADLFIVKMNKWLEKNAPAEDDAAGLMMYDKLVALLNSAK